MVFVASTGHLVPAVALFIGSLSLIVCLWLKGYSKIAATTLRPSSIKML